MTNELLAPIFLFKLFEAAGISKRELARLLGVSQPLVTLWSQAKRAITWRHFNALMDIAFAPATIWKIAERLKRPGSLPGLHPFQEFTPQFFVYKLISLAAYYQHRVVELYEDIQATTRQLAACTSGELQTWDIPLIQELHHRLTVQLKDAPLLTMHLDPRLEKALNALKDALEDSYYQEDTHATTDANRLCTGESGTD